MNAALIVVLVGLLGAACVWCVIRLFADRTYRAGPANSWAQRNDRRRESRGPDNDFAATGSGVDGAGGAAE